MVSTLPCFLLRRTEEGYPNTAIQMKRFWRGRLRRLDCGSRVLIVRMISRRAAPADDAIRVKATAMREDVFFIRFGSSSRSSVPCFFLTVIAVTRAASAAHIAKQRGQI